MKFDQIKTWLRKLFPKKENPLDKDLREHGLKLLNRDRSSEDILQSKLIDSSH